MKFFQTTSTFDYTWEQVAQAFWLRYPNPESSHVLSEDTIFREVRDGKLYTKKLFTKTNSIPGWCERFVTNGRVVKILEESVVDPKTRQMRTHTRNLGYTSVMGVVERVTYKASEDGKTVAVRSATFDSNVYGFARALQAFGVERFKKNCVKAVHGYNFVLNRMFPRSQNLSHTDDVNRNTNSITQTGKDKLKGAAKKATDLAKSKTAPMFANIDT